MFDPNALTLSVPRICDMEDVPSDGYESPCACCHRKVWIAPCAVLFVPLDVQVVCLNCVLRRMPNVETLDVVGEKRRPMGEALAERRAELRAERDERVVGARGHRRVRGGRR